jgi:hypothetical protein
MKTMRSVLLNLILMWLLFLTIQAKIPEPAALLIWGVGLIYISKLIRKETVDLHQVRGFAPMGRMEKEIP